MSSSPMTARQRSRAVFYLPFVYFISTRLGGKAAILSWIMIYPVALLVSVAPDLGGANALPAMLLAMLATYSLYELGYMDNDTRTVRGEISPTERLDTGEKDYFGRMGWLIFAVRLVVVVAACSSIAALSCGTPDGRMAFFAGLGVIAIVFPLYNSLRGRANLPLHFVLVVCRFCLPGMVVTTHGFAEYLGMTVAAFPFINLLERAGESRYGLSLFAPLLTFKARVRVIYYLILTAAATAIWISTDDGGAALILMVYFLVYRLVSPMIFKHTSGNAIARADLS